MLPYAIKDLWRWLMPIGGSSLISLLGVLSGPGAEFLWCGGCYSVLLGLY